MAVPRMLGHWVFNAMILALGIGLDRLGTRLSAKRPRAVGSLA